jgi:enoyl-CoA hydratase/carnithine racemase
MANELIEAFAAISEDDAVRVVIVTGAGKAFCAGMDLSKRATSSAWTKAWSPRSPIWTSATTTLPS